MHLNYVLHSIDFSKMWKREMLYDSKAPYKYNNLTWDCCNMMSWRGIRTNWRAEALPLCKM